MILEVILIIVVTYLLWRFLYCRMRVKNYDKKYVFITGCDTGFGHKLAIHLDKMGFHVIAGCLTQDGCLNLSQICTQRTMTLMLNVTSNDSIQEALNKTQQVIPEGKGLWAVVNNAGIVGQAAGPEFCLKQDFLDACDVNLFGPIEVCRVFLPLLRKSKGRIINMSSMAGRFSGASVTYTVSKFGIEAFSDILRRDMSYFGVKVILIEPGFFNTTILNPQKFESEVSKAYERSNPEVQKAYGRYYVKAMSYAHQSLTKLGSNDIQQVVDAYTDAVTLRHPKSRFVVGNDAMFIFLPLSYMPDWMSDGLMMMVRKMRRKQLVSFCKSK